MNILCLQVVMGLLDRVCHKWLEKWEYCGWQIHHDNAPAHSAHHVLQFLAEHSIPQMRQIHTHQVWLPLTSLCSLNLKKTLKGKRFDTLKLTYRKRAAAGDSKY